MVFVIYTRAKHIFIETDIDTAIEIMNAIAVAYGPEGLSIRGTDKSGEMSIDVSDWSISNEWAIFLCENADNLDLECPF